MQQHVFTSESIGLIEYMKRVWQYRSLIKILAIRDIKIQYAQTFLGLIWAFLQPLVAVLIYSTFFYILLGINTDPVPYPIFVIPGILCWFHFSRLVNEVGISLQEQQDLIKKVEFPRLIVPISKTISGLVNVGFTLLLFFIVLLLFSYTITWQIIFFPVFFILNIFMGLSIAIWLSALTIRYRDLNHLIPFLISFGIWITPVFYPTTILPEQYEEYIYINPLAGVLAGYRWSLLDYGEFSWYYGISIGLGIILFITGLRYFISTEHQIADYV